MKEQLVDRICQLLLCASSIFNVPLSVHHVKRLFLHVNWLHVNALHSQCLTKIEVSQVLPTWSNVGRLRWPCNCHMTKRVFLIIILCLLLHGLHEESTLYIESLVAFLCIPLGNLSSSRLSEDKIHAICSESKCTTKQQMSPSILTWVLCMYH